MWSNLKKRSTALSPASTNGAHLRITNSVFDYQFAFPRVYFRQIVPQLPITNQLPIRPKSLISNFPNTPKSLPSYYQVFQNARIMPKFSKTPRVARRPLATIFLRTHAPWLSENYSAEFIRMIIQLIMSGLHTCSDDSAISAWRLY